MEVSLAMTIKPEIVKKKKKKKEKNTADTVFVAIISELLVEVSWKILARIWKYCILERPFSLFVCIDIILSRV